MDIDQMSFAELRAVMLYHLNDSLGIDVDRVVEVAQAMQRAYQQPNNTKAAA